MMEVRHTKDRERNYRIAGITFPTGTREIDVDEETALQAADHSHIELVDEESEESEESEEVEESDAMDSTFYDGYTDGETDE